MRPLALAALLTVFAAPAAGAQAPDAFAAAAIRPNTSGGGNMSVQVLPGGRFVADNITVKELIRAAYQFELEPSQIVGGPAWIETERFDIQATAGGEAAPVEVLAMVRSLMADRFGLVTRRDTRDLTVFRLVIARDDGRLGPGMKRPAGGCTPRVITRQGSAAQEPGLPLCGFSYLPDIGDVQRHVGTGVTTDDLARQLRRHAGGIVINHTGLTGRYDLTLDYLPPSVTPQQGNGVSLFTAVQEQLGLRLESRREPVAVLVIDEVERPTPN
jgi:uncharacterized protein (TIGR03435 family)